MKRELIVILIIFVGIVGFLSGYYLGANFQDQSQENNDDSKNTNVNNNTNGSNNTNENVSIEYINSNSVLFTISLERSEYFVGEQINVTLTFTNIEDEAQKFQLFVLGGNTYFNITNSSGTQMSELWEDEFGPMDGTLQPGESYSQTVVVQHLYEDLPPESYTIQAKYSAMGIFIKSINQIPFDVM